MPKGKELTPKEIVAALDQYIVGQRQAKRSVAIALRNRYRRSLLSDELREEITPKNILMIGPTGVGKTEIARRLAKLVNAPFIKVEATKFTEVGYVGRDVESIVRDLMEVTIRMVKNEKFEQVKEKAEILANEQIVSLLVPAQRKNKPFKNPLEMLFQSEQNKDGDDEPEQSTIIEHRRQIAEDLSAGKLEDRIIEIEVEETMPSMFDIFSGTGVEQMGINLQDMLGSFLPKRTKKRKVTVKEARKILTQEQAQNLIDMDACVQEAVQRAEQSGIVFIDEIDKIAGKESRGGADVSREGVQRDILPIVEGSTVMTKYGPIKTDYMLFIAAGAFHMSKPSDLIPELQGRFPIRVELQSLGVDDFVQILTEPTNALTKQYTALIETEGIRVEFTEEAIYTIAELAAKVNQEVDNIGARRLHTILEKLFEELSFEASDVLLEKVTITPQYVKEKLQDIVADRNLTQYIL